MRYTSIIILSLFTFFGLQSISIAQDKIITMSHDTLDAKVIKITEQITSYKLSSYIDGPTYELDNKRITKILYFNGEEFSFENGSPQGTPIFDKHKNSIEFIASELTMMRFSLGYSRFYSTNFEIKLEGSASIVNAYQSNGENFLNYAGVQLNYHPLSFRKFDYYIGIRGRLGNHKNYYYYEPYYYNGQTYYSNSVRNTVVGTVGVMNGIRANLTQRFAIDFGLSLDILFEETRGVTQPAAGGILGVCYNF